MSWVYQFKSYLASFRTLRRIGFYVHRAIRMPYMMLAQRRHGVNPRKVVFESFEGRGYNDNPRFVSEKLHELCPEAEIVWIFRPDTIKTVQAPDYVKRILPLSWSGLREQATARFWVDNFRRTANLYLNTDRQYYINTWHGDRGFKKVGDDNDKLVKAPVMRMEKNCAMMIAGSEFGANNYRTAFHMKGDILMDGCPRNDMLLRNDPAQAADVRRRLGIAPETGILMYAPTYRDDRNREQAAQDPMLDMPRTLDFLEAHTAKRWVCLCRTHYLSFGMNVADDPRIIPASDWPEMAELLLVTDMLITDYSSCGADFTLLRRPMFLYQADVGEYLDQSRSFYFPMETSPFLIAHSQEELEKLILETDAAKARENGEALDRFFRTTETGHAAEAVCRYIMDRMKD